MTEELLTQRVEIRFVGTPPVRQVERASGVSGVEIDGPILRCVVSGSFQPFLEALRGYEVFSLQATPAPTDTGQRVEGKTATGKKLHAPSEGDQ